MDVSGQQKQTQPINLVKLREFFSRGWWARLSYTESGLWLAYLSHADKITGESFPKAPRLAALLGHSSMSHVRDARSSLARHGLITILGKNTGGRGHSPRVRVEMPPMPAAIGQTRPESDTVSQPQTRPESGQQTRPESDHKPAPNRDNPPAPPNKEEPTNNPPFATTRGGCAADAAVKKAAEILREKGVNGARAETLARQHPLERVRAVCQLAEKKGQRLGNPAGFIVSALAEGYPDRPKPGGNGNGNGAAHADEITMPTGPRR